MPPRFVELIRVSGEAQESRDTPADQRRALDRLRETRPGILVERIDLGAVSGASDKRPDLERVFALAKACAFDELRVRHLDRLTRHDDLRQRAEIFGRLLDAKAVIVDASGHVIDPSTELGELDYSLQTWMAAKERRRILERTQAARKRLAAEGKIQGRPPYARTWDKRTGTWGEDKGAMAVYRRIFREVLAGRTLADIAERLNGEGVPTPLGRNWTAAHVGRLVKHRSATGEIRGWGHVYRCPAVVTAIEWEAAQDALRRRRSDQAGPRGHHPALLRRVLSCGVCGARMWVQRGGRKDDVRSFYVCSTYRATTEPDCRRWHPVEAVDLTVQQEILLRARHPERLAAAAKERPRDVAGSARKEAERAAKELQRLDREAERLARLMRRDLLPEHVAVAQLKEIAKLRNHAEVEERAAKARATALERATKEHRDLAQETAEMAKRLERATLSEWREFLKRQEALVRLFPDGTIRLSLLLDALPQRKRASMH